MIRKSKELEFTAPVLAAGAVMHNQAVPAEHFQLPFT